MQPDIVCICLSAAIFSPRESNFTEYRVFFSRWIFQKFICRFTNFPWIFAKTIRRILSHFPLLITHVQIFIRYFCLSKRFVTRRFAIQLHNPINIPSIDNLKNGRVSESIIFAQQRRNYNYLWQNSVVFSQSQLRVRESRIYSRIERSSFPRSHKKRKERERERKKKEDNVDSAKARHAEALNSRNPSGGHETSRTLIPIAQARRTTSTRYALRDDTTCTRVHVSSSRTYAREKRTWLARARSRFVNSTNGANVRRARGIVLRQK